MPVKPTSADVPRIKSLGNVSPRPKPKLTVEDMETFQKEQKLKAKYKIEIIFSRHRSSRMGVPSPLMLLIWESGKRFHGGGDQRMYWCGYDDCGKPMSSDNFAYMHVVCPECQREMFLDPDSKKAHVQALEADRKDASDVRRMPFVVGERLANLTPLKLAELLEKTWRNLNGDADIYLKYSPYQIRYDPKEETTDTIDRLNNIRVQKKPLIYTLKSILKDLNAGAELKKRFLAMITS